jgi:hypothetical protein
MSEENKGGEGGKIFINAKKINGDGEIIADGGDGEQGGKGGEVGINVEENNFTGDISASGGKSNLNSEKWHQEWWGKLIIGITVTVTGGILVYLITNFLI